MFSAAQKDLLSSVPGIFFTYCVKSSELTLPSKGEILLQVRLDFLSLIPYPFSIKNMSMTMKLRQIAMSSALVMLANIGIAQAADMSSSSDATSGNSGGTAAAGEASTNAANTAPSDPFVKARVEKRQAKEQYKEEKKAAKKDYKEAKSAANQELNASRKAEESN